MFDESYLIREPATPEGYKRRQSGLYMRDQPMVRFADSPSSGQAHIPRSWALTINGQTVSPTCVYLASDINTGTGAWAEHFGDADGAMTLQAGSPTYDVDSLFGVGGGDDEYVKGDGSTWWKTSVNGFGNPGTDDYISEIVLRLPDPGAVDIVAEMFVDATHYVTFQTNASHQVVIGQRNGGTAKSISSPAMSAGALVHYMALVDVSGQAKAYANLSASSGVAFSGDGDLSFAAPLTLFDRNGGGVAGFGGHLHSFALWHASGVLDVAGAGHADIVAERFRRWCGILPQLAPPGGYLPTFTRSTTKYFYRSDQSKLHLGGAGLLAGDDQGVQINAAATNKALQSEDFATTWAQVDAGDTPTTDVAVAPNGATTMDANAADSTAGQHGFEQTITLTAASWVISCFVKKGNWDYFCIYDASIANGNAWFNLSTGAVGTKGAACNAYGIEDVGGGIYRCWASVTGTAAGHLIRLLSCTSDGTVVSDTSGDGSTKNTYFWGAQVELGVYPSPYIPTTTAAVTRNADNLDLNSAIATRLADAGEGTIECEVMLPNFDLAADATVFALSDGSAAESLVVKIAASGDQAEADMRSAGGNNGDADVVADIVDGSWHTLSCSWRYNRLSLIVDGTEAVDTDCAVPSGINELLIGRNVADGAHLNGHIRNLRIWDYARY